MKKGRQDRIAETLTVVMIFFRNECNDEDVSFHPRTPYLSGAQKKGEGSK